MSINSLGVRKVLLTDQEARCYKVARRYQRKNLINRLLQYSGPAELRRLLRLRWSSNPLVFLLQIAVLCCVFPFAISWLIIRKFFEMLAFPYLYGKTFLVPGDLAAPGEKTLLGVHYAFSRYMDADLASYIYCLREWILILYGEDALRRIMLDDELEAELKRLEAERNVTTRNVLNSNEFPSTARSLMANVREKISKKLGHYNRVR